MALNTNVQNNVKIEENVAKEDPVDEVKNMKDFTRKCRMDDLELIVDGKSLHVSKTVLALVSPVFQRMFQGELRESQATSLKLPGKSCEIFHTFLQSIYPCGLDVVSEENVFAILPLADEYQVSNLKTKCCKRLLERLMRKHQVKHLFQILEVASWYGIEQVVDKCCACIVKEKINYKNMEKVEEGFSISPETKIFLRNKLIVDLEKRLQHSQSENLGANKKISSLNEDIAYVKEKFKQQTHRQSVDDRKTRAWDGWGSYD